MTIKSNLTLLSVFVLIFISGGIAFHEYRQLNNQDANTGFNGKNVSDKPSVIKTGISAESTNTEICDREQALKRCNSLILKGKSRACIDLSNDFIAQCGDYDQLYPYINAAARKLSDWDVALHAANKVIEFFPYNYNSYWMRSATYEDKGDFENAGKDLFQVLSLEPKVMEAPFHLAQILTRLGRPCDAISPLTQFIFHHPDHKQKAKNLINQLYSNPECVSLHSDGSAKIRINKDGQSMTSKASINGYPGDNFIIDTGASTVTLNSKFAEKIGLDFKEWPSRIMHTANGDVTAYIGFVNSVEVHGVKATHVEAAVLTNLGDIDGLLGLSFLGRFNIKLDVKSGYISLNSKDDADGQGYSSQSGR